MSLPLTPEVLAAAYEYLRRTPPFAKWNLPHADSVAFRVIKSRDAQGYHYLENSRHVIEVSCRVIGRTQSLLEVMAHEMVHAHEKEAYVAGKAEHSATFKSLAAQVCTVHGFDPKLF